MKKTTVVITITLFILGISSLASAGYEIVPGLEYEILGNTFTLTGTDVTGYLFNLQPDSGILSNVFINTDFSFQYPGVWYSSYGLLAAEASVGTSSAVTGTIFSIDFTPGAKELTFVYSSFVGDSTIWIGGEEILLTGKGTSIPEPVTLLLLGMGGVLIRKRK